MMKKNIHRCSIATLLQFFLIVLISMGIIGGCDNDHDNDGGGGTSETQKTFDNADLARGGRLYDKWWSENDADEPETNPNYPKVNNPNERN